MEPEKPTQPNLDVIRHSAAHVLAMAAMRIYPEAKIGVGPVTADGFYYDFEFPNTLAWEDVKKIEQEMQIIIQESLPFSQLSVPKEQAFDILLNRRQIYKAELLRELPEEIVSFYKTGDEFIDLCRGPHVSNTNQVGVVKLNSLTTTYWQGDESRPRLQRIHGTAFPTLSEMQKYEHQQEAIKTRDFYILAKKMGLTVGGSRDLIYTPTGLKVIKKLEEQVLSAVETLSSSEVSLAPVTDLTKISSQMNELFAVKNRSYKELPLRFYSSSREELDQPIKILGKEIRSAHAIYLKSYHLPEQSGIEVRNMTELFAKSIENLNMQFRAEIHAPQLELRVLTDISDQLSKLGISQTVVLDTSKDHVLVQAIVTDSLGRDWHIAELVFSASLAEFISRQGEFTRANQVEVIWILEKLLAYFLENGEGFLPTWLAATQAIVIPITDYQVRYAKQVKELLEEYDYRVEVDARSETMQSKIRDAELYKTPIIIVVGEKEAKSNSVSLRLHDRQEIGLISLDQLISTMEELSKD